MTTDLTKPIPKSLHTVTVLVKLAGLFQRTQGYYPADALAAAVAFLGYADTPDAHGLAAAALKVMGK